MFTKSHYLFYPCIILIVILTSNTHSQDTTVKDRPYPLPAETPGTPVTIETEVIGPFRVWHIVGFCACGILIIVIIVCCCVDVRIPRTKEDIEASYQQRMLNKKFTEDMANPFTPSNFQEPASKRVPSRGAITNPSFTPDEPDIIFASEPSGKPSEQRQGKEPRISPRTDKRTTGNGQVSRNPSGVSERNDYQIRTNERPSRTTSNVSNYSRNRDFYSKQQQQQQPKSFNGGSLDGSATIENSKNFQRERIAHQNSRGQQKEAALSNQRGRNNSTLSDYEPENKSRKFANISRVARFGVQTPLANHPSMALGPKRSPQEGHPSLASTARTLAAMSPHPGHMSRH